MALLGKLHIDMSPRLARKLSHSLKPSTDKIRKDCNVGLSFVLQADEEQFEFNAQIDNRSAIEVGLKKAVDVFGSLVLLIALSPIIAAVSILLFVLNEDHTIFYEDKRVGKDGKLFSFYKFRTMYSKSDALKEMLEGRNQMSGPFFKIADDPRVTEVGRFLRKFSIDELPQLFNVFKGDMSLVGPRPCQPDEYMKLKQWQQVAKTYMKPGITCIWQTSGRNLIADHNQWMKLDLEYISNWSFLLDIKLLLKTIPAVISARGAS